MTSRPSRKFQELLLTFSQSEEIKERRKIEEGLWEEFGGTCLASKGKKPAHMELKSPENYIAPSVLAVPVTSTAQNRKQTPQIGHFFAR